MKHPVWLFNSTLLLFLLLMLIFFIIFRPVVPPYVSFEPSTDIKPYKKELPKVDLSKIYNNDLFDTYKQPFAPIKIEPEITEKPMPQPPVITLPTKPPIPPPKFLEPLKITVRGIIIGTTDHLNTAIIEDMKEKRSKNYKIGDIIEDAQLIRILKNKVIFIRSNGQQETLYVNQHDAELELLLSPNNWEGVIKKIKDDTYHIDPDLFVEHIRSLAQFIDILNITTVYRQGKSIGCRIGKIDANSLGYALGLMPGDIIVSVNQIPTVDTKSRVAIYKNIIDLQVGQTITVQLLRRNQQFTIDYTLTKLTPLAQQKESTLDRKAFDKIEKEKEHILERRYKFAPTAKEIRKQEKQNIIDLMKHRTEKKESKNILTNTVQQ